VIDMVWVNLTDWAILVFSAALTVLFIFAAAELSFRFVSRLFSRRRSRDRAT
jgi:hypothetical protein